jgi:hypothetical protein
LARSADRRQNFTPALWWTEVMKFAAPEGWVPNGSMTDFDIPAGPWSL